MGGKGQMQKSGQQVSKTELPQWQVDAWKQLSQAAGGYFMPGGQPMQATAYGGQFTPSANPLQQAGMSGLLGGQRPDFTTMQNLMVDNAAAAQSWFRDPNSVNFSNIYQQPQAYQASTFQAPNVSMQDTLAGYKPDLQAFQTDAAQAALKDFQAREYNFTPERIAAERIAGPDRSSIRDVSGFDKNLQSYLMANPERIQLGELEKYQMSPAERVAAGQISAQNFTDEGVREKYMDPYMKDVIEGERRKAIETFGGQLTKAGAAAAAAGALGGSRQAILQGEMQRDFANQMGDITATGLERAYQNAQQQFERDRAAQMGAGQFNAQQAMQAALANQAMGMNVGQQNLQALLQTQGLGRQTELQAGMANQQANLEAAKANQAALLGTQQLGTQTGMQAALANQQADIGYAGMGLEAARANQQAFLEAARANQGTGLQAQIEGAKLGSQERQFGAGLSQEGALANAKLQQEANLANLQSKLGTQQLGANLGFEALKTQYGGNLQMGLANQQAAIDSARLGEQSRQFGYGQAQQAGQFGAELNLNTQQQQAAARDALIRSNLAAQAAAQSSWKDVAGLDQQNWANQMAQAQNQWSAGMQQAGLDQRGLELAYNEFIRQQQYPMEAMKAYASIMSGVPFMGTQTTDMYQKTPGWGQSLGGFAMMGAGLLAPGGGNFLSLFK